MITAIDATETASRLIDLTDDKWLVVARQIRAGVKWDYTMPPADMKAFDAAVTHCEIIAMQRREDEGFVLLAKLARVRGSRR